MSKQANDWIGDHIGEGEPAKLFAPHVKVWSEMAVRAAIMRALESYENGKHTDAVDNTGEKGSESQ